VGAYLLFPRHAAIDVCVDEDCNAWPLYLKLVLHSSSETNQIGNMISP